VPARRHHDLPLLQRLRQLAADGPIVVAHRGDSRNFPENTLPAFAVAVQLGVAMIEFDVQATADQVLVCLHDDTLDRTTDALRVLGAGALVAQSQYAELSALDAGSWKGTQHRGARVPTLEEALAVMLPRAVPMIEHKGGRPELYVELLRRLGLGDAVLLQSFDWEFLAAVRRLEPRIELGALGPNARWPALTPPAIAAAQALGAGFVHWRALELRGAQVDAAHQAGLLVVSYTTDDEIGLRGGALMGIDAMCTNDPANMLALRGSGALRR